MKTLKQLITIPFLALSLNTNAQKDNCGCVKDIKKNYITIPYVKGGICIQFFYDNEWITQVVYDSWKGLVSDFSFSSKDSALIKFDWNKIDQFREGNNGWDAVVHNSEGKRYLGRYFDMTRNYDVEKIRIVDIKTSCFYPACSPDRHVFSIGVNLTEK